MKTATRSFFVPQFFPSSLDLDPIERVDARLDSEADRFFSSRANIRRLRRSPCLGDLVRACQGRPQRRRGEEVVRELVQNHEGFFRRSDLWSRSPVLRCKGDWNRVFDEGVLSGYVDIEEPGKEPFWIPQSLPEGIRKEFLLHTRAEALRRLTLSNVLWTDASPQSSPITSTTSMGVSEFSGDFEIEVNQKLAKQLTGYSFEKPADIIREHGAQLIDEGLVTEFQLHAIAAKTSGGPVFLGSWLPPEAIVGILQDGRHIWKRPMDTIDPTEKICNTRFDKVLNVAVNPTETVEIAQRYLYRKHSAITDNYTLRSESQGSSSPRMEPMGSQPERRPLPTQIRVHILGAGNASASPFGITSFEELKGQLVELMRQRKLEGEIGMEPTFSLSFIGCGSLSEQQVAELRENFRKSGFSLLTIDQRPTLGENEGAPADLDFILSLSPEIFTAQVVRQLGDGHPNAVVYHVRKPGPSVRRAVLYRKEAWTAPAPPRRLRINVLGHGENAENFAGVSFSHLADLLAARVRDGQTKGEFHAEAKVTLNFVSCRTSLSSAALALFYQAFKKKGIRLAEVHFRDTELLVDTVGRKLQQSSDGQWEHAHSKRIFKFDADGSPSETMQSMPEPHDAFVLRDAAGPLLAKEEGRYHIRQLTDTLDSIRTENRLSADWRPDLSSLTKISGNRYQIDFRKNEEVATITTDQSSLERFNKFAKTHAKVVGGQLQLQGDVLRPLVVQTSGNSDLHLVSRGNRLLSSISALRALIDETKSLQHSYADEIRAHTLVNLAQNIHVLGNEGVDLAQSLGSSVLQKEAVIEGEGALRAARFLKGTNRMMGAGLMAANVGFDIYELTQARTPEEKWRSGLSLGLDGAFVGLELAALSGATVAGPLALLLGLSLLAFEFGEWLYKQHTAHDGRASVYRYLENLQRVYSDQAIQYDASQDLLHFAPGAVITKVMLEEQPGIRFASQTLAVAKVKVCDVNLQSPTGGTVVFKENTNRSLNIRSEMGWPERREIPPQWASASKVHLPVSPRVSLQYRYRSSAGLGQIKETEGARLLRQLSQKDRDLQITACAGNVISSLIPLPQNTEIEVVLGSQDRVLLMPADLPQEVGRCLKYLLKGKGGNYKLLPARNAEFLLQEVNQTTAVSNWVIDLSSLGELEDLNYSLTKETLTFHDAVKGPVKIHIGGVAGNIEVHSKLRKWRLDRKANQLRLFSMNFGGTEVPQSQGASLRTNISRHLTRIPVLKLAKRMGLQIKDPTAASALTAAFQAIPLSADLHLTDFPLKRIPQTVVYDVPNERLITAGSDKLPQANYAGRSRGSFYFSMGRMFWKGSAPGQPSSGEQSLFFEQARDHSVNIWEKNGDTFLSQTVPLRNTGTRLEAIYQLNKKDIPSLMKLTVPVDFLRRFPDLSSVSASEAFRAIEEIAAGSPLVSSALVTTATKSALISLVCRDQRGEEHRFWLDITHNQVIPVGKDLPTDAVPLANTSSGSAFLYSDSAKSLYHRVSNSANSVLFLTGICGLKLVEGRMQVELKEGITYEITGDGKKKLIAIGPQWTAAHRSTWVTDLERLTEEQEAADSIAIHGLKLANGPSLLCWYDRIRNQFTLAPDNLLEEKLLHLGFVSPDGGAWLFQPESGRLYQQPTFTGEWMKWILNQPEKALLATVRLAKPTSVMPQEKFNQVIHLQDGRAIGHTESGLILLLDPKNAKRPLVLAANSRWLSQEAHQGKQLAFLAEDDEFNFHWNIDLLGGNSHNNRSSLNWYDIAARKRIAVPTETSDWDYVGYAASTQTAYFGNATKLIGVGQSETRGPQSSETQFQYPNRDKNILSLFVKPTEGTSQASPPPALAGVDTLLLQGNPDGLTIDQELWNHHRLILFNRLPREGSQKADAIHLQLPGAENLTLKKVENDLVLERSDQPKSTRLIFREYFLPGKTWNLSLHFPNGTQRRIRPSEFTHLR